MGTAAQDTALSRADELRQRRTDENAELKRQFRKYQTWGWFSVGLLMLIVPGAMGVFPWVPPLIAWPLAVAACASLAAMSIKRSRVKELREEIRRMDFQLDLVHLDPSPEEMRAEQLLHINEYTLRQYYELTLSQSGWIFVVGVVCLAFGLLIVSGTIYVLAYAGKTGRNSEWSDQLAIGIVGAIGSILSSYVAATYLKMHASAAANLVSLHARLVGAHHLYFANVLASRLPETDRAKVLANMALALASSDNHPAQPSESAAAPG